MKESNKYTALVRPEIEDGDLTYEAVFKEFGRSAIGTGSTPAQALSNLYKNGDALLELLREAGKEVPEPEDPPEWLSYSGKMTVRMPKSLHWKLHMLSGDEGVSLNTLVVSILAWGAEQKHCDLTPISSRMINLKVNHHFQINWTRAPGSPFIAEVPVQPIRIQQPALV